MLLRCCPAPTFLGRRFFAGHSKWATIQRSKGANDVARGALFTKISKMLSSAVRAGGPDPSTNLRLASALDAAKKSSVPKDLIERALKSKEGVVTEELLFEAVGPGGVALLITCNTDNSRRTTPAIKYILGKHSSALGATRAFVQKGIVSLGGGAAAAGNAAGTAAGTAAGAALLSEEAIMEAALSAGAEDVEMGDEGTTAKVTCPREATSGVRSVLLAAGLPVSSVLLTRVATSSVALEAGSEEEATFAALLEKLEEQEDVLSVLHNAE